MVGKGSPVRVARHWPSWAGEDNEQSLAGGGVAEGCILIRTPGRGREGGLRAACREVGLAGLNPITAAHPATRTGGTPGPGTALSSSDWRLRRQKALDSGFPSCSEVPSLEKECHHTLRPRELRAERDDGGKGQEGGGILPGNTSTQNKMMVLGKTLGYNTPRTDSTQPVL